MSDFFTWKAEVRALFNPTAIEAAKRHAEAEWPKESCGLIVSGAYIPCFNYAVDPTTHFHIAPQVLAGHLDGLQAVVHSHPKGPIYPSEMDMAGQIATDVPWIIVTVSKDEPTGVVAAHQEVVIWGDTLPVAPLLERPFVWGVFDCYTLVRDYYRIHHDKILPAVPREDGYWERGGDLYGEFIKKMGFQEIEPRDARPGDGFLVSINSPVPNHAGILGEGGLIWHHLPNRLSRREPAGIWSRAADIWVRHPELNQDEA